MAASSQDSASHRNESLLIDHDSRIAALETALSEMQQTLRLVLGQSQSLPAPEVDENASYDALNPELPQNPTINVSGDAEPPIASPIAPVQVIRKMNTWITGAAFDRHEELDVDNSARETLIANDLRAHLIAS